MQLANRLTKVFSNLRLREMRWIWIIWTTKFFLVALSFFLIEEIVWFSVFATTIFALATILSWHEYQRALRTFETKVSVGRMESIVTNLEDAVIAYSSDFKILIFNAAAERFFGLSKNQVIGQTMGPERAGEKGYQTLTQTLFPSLAPVVVGRSEPNQYPQIVDISFESPNREFRVSTDKIADKSGRILGFVKVIRDRTREIELVKSKSEFVSVAAHQLRTPLTAINWTLEGLRDNPGLSEEDKTLAKNGMQATANLLKTVNDLLDTAEIEGGRFGYEYKEVELVKFIEDILANAQVVAKEYGLQVFFDKGGLKESKVFADPTKLGIALSNLIDNAMKYNSKNGSVTVRLKAVPPKPFVQISVQDTGVGIPPADMGKIFAKFYRASNARKVHADGSGLGLYITKNIITQHGGEIWVESTLGRGTTFFLTLPTDPSLVPRAESATLT
ncbi:MAG: ATP-binding protein [bacterium]|nr:ATP-binding protein [bacterium]